MNANPKFLAATAHGTGLLDTVQIVKDRNQDMPSDMLEAMIDDAVREIRATAAVAAES